MYLIFEQIFPTKYRRHSSSGQSAIKRFELEQYMKGNWYSPLICHAIHVSSLYSHWLRYIRIPAIGTRWFNYCRTWKPAVSIGGWYCHRHNVPRVGSAWSGAENGVRGIGRWYTKLKQALGVDSLHSTICVRYIDLIYFHIYIYIYMGKYYYKIFIKIFSNTRIIELFLPLGV